jgi:hypothetical protein
MGLLDGFLKGFEEGYEMAKDGVTFAAEKAEDMSYAARLKLRIFGLKRKIDRYHMTLGRSVYTLFKAGEDKPLDNDKVGKLLGDIAATEEEVLTLLKELEQLSDTEKNDDEPEVVEAEVVEEE